MLKKNIEINKEIKPNSRDVELLKSNFPHFFNKDGEFLYDNFKHMLKENKVIFDKEGYELKFLGKSYARYLSSTKTETFIAPHVEENNKKENINSENLYIIGDNIDALKHLLGSYSRKIKCIYIDPPYNTGSDGFVYPDNFQFDAKKLSDILGIDEEEAKKIINLKGKSSHSAWLTFMYPRLILARELLSDDGVIFISIDDNEQANLKLMCDEIFGEENFIANVVWTNKEGGGSSDSKHFRIKHEYILVYGKLKELVFINGLEVEDVDRYKLQDEYVNIRGKYQLIKLDSASIQYSKSLDYPILAPDGMEIYPGNKKKRSCWRWGKEKLEWGIKNSFIEIKKDKNNEWAVYTKQYLNCDNEGNIKPRTLQPIAIIDKFSTTQSNKKLEELLGKNIFNYSKQVELIKLLIQISTSKNDIILDFFSGSATTAHAVMQLNAEDGGDRKYILGQIPEKITEDKLAYKANYRTIDEIGRARIKRAAEKIKKETGANIDYGFKTYSIVEPTNKILTELETFEPNLKLIDDDMISIYDTNIAKGKESILSTYLVLDGYGLNKNSEKYKLKNYVADKMDDTLYLINMGLTSEDVMELIKRLESLELDINRIVIYTYSMKFNILLELKKNIENLRNNKQVKLIERY